MTGPIFAQVLRVPDRQFAWIASQAERFQDWHSLCSYDQTTPHQSTKAWSARVVSPSVMSGTAPVTLEIGTVWTNHETFVRVWQVVP